MTANPLTIRTDATVSEAAECMAQADVGPIPVVTAEGALNGMLTDRDIVVRVVAAHKDPETCRVGEVATEDIASLSPDASVEEAIELMRTRALRRVPVVDNERVIGIVSIGDLALERDPDSALADISGAPANS